MSEGNSTDFAQIITWLIVIGGWWIVNHQQDRRETRKEIRARLNEVRSRLELLENKSHVYHTSEHDQATAREIKLHLTRLWFEAELLCLAKENLLSQSLTRLRRSITLNNFESKTHKPLPDDDQLIATISAAVVDLESLLEKGYSTHYLPKR
ncbi:MAG: hypothetical protein BMS9Abin06_0451 [Gammaproteobacteria bacterium]|nr:MAG: hypothetical protein BMS9Abin06_0451 [Gammaproteobacteria bacterium]